MTRDSKLNKGKLVRILIEKGFSTRRARKAVNAVFAIWAKHLKYGETVAVPGGKLRVVHKEKEHRFQRLYHFPTKKAKYRIVHRNRQKKAIVFLPALKLPFQPDPKAKAPEAPFIERPAMREVRQLMSDLLGYPATDYELSRVAVELMNCGARPTALVERLRFVKGKALPGMSLWDLCAWVRNTYWIR
jgi:hypothetical protein